MSITPEEAKAVQKAAAELAIQAVKIVPPHPIFPVAALTMAACHAAIMTGMPYEDLNELFKLHFTTAHAGLEAHAANAPTIPQPPEQQ